MSSSPNTNTSAIDVPHSQPINIDPGRGRQNRRRSESISDSDNSPPPKTPSSPSRPMISPSTSPILSYFLSQQQSPTTKTAFPFSTPLGTAVEGVEDHDDDNDDFVKPPPTSAHARRMSTSWNPVLFGNGTSVAPAPTPSQEERGKGLLRRLSLGGAMQRPSFGRPTSPPPRVGTPPKSAGMGAMQNPGTPRRTHRAATVGTMQGSKIPRSPSPMGERILKGHFDGFN